MIPRDEASKEGCLYEIYANSAWLRPPLPKVQPVNVTDGKFVYAPGFAERGGTAFEFDGLLAFMEKDTALDEGVRGAATEALRRIEKN